MSTRKTTLFYAILIAVASTAVGMVIASQWGLPQASSAQTIAAPPMNSAPLAGGLDAATFRNIAKTQVATVVYISTSAHLKNRDLTDNSSEDLLRRFFGQGRRPGRVRARAGAHHEDASCHGILMTRKARCRPAPAPASSSTRAASS